MPRDESSEYEYPPFTPFVLFLSLQEYTLTGLKTYTQYLVSLRVFNPEGDGPETIVVVMTDEGGESRR